MKCYIIDTFEGIFALDDSGNIVNFRDFDDDSQRIIKFYEAIEDDIIITDMGCEVLNKTTKELVIL